jgi:hypothetical protein
LVFGSRGSQCSAILKWEPEGRLTRCYCGVWFVRTMSEAIGVEEGLGKNFLLCEGSGLKSHFSPTNQLRHFAMNDNIRAYGRVVIHSLLPIPILSSCRAIGRYLLESRNQEENQPSPIPTRHWLLQTVSCSRCYQEKERKSIEYIVGRSMWVSLCF